MNKATLKDFDNIWSIFKKYKNVFPHIRTDYLKRQIKNRNVIFENNVVLVTSKYKRKVNLGNRTFDKNTIIIHQIVNDDVGNGCSSVLIKKFLNEVRNKIILTVRKSNKIARRFYEKNNFKEVSKIFWSNNQIEGVIYEYNTTI